VRGLILSKLSLPALARAAPTCQEFKDACVGKVADKRADLIRAGEGGLGRDSFRALVAAVQRPLCGCSPSQSLFSGPGGSRHGDHGRRSSLICFTEPFDSEASEHTMPVVQSLASKGSAIVIDRPTSVSHLFSAHLFQGVLGDVPCLTKFNVYRFGRNNVYLRLLVRKEGGTSAMGLLLAISTEISEALPAYCRSPLTVDIFLWGFPVGAAVVREVEELVAPLRLLAECINIYPRINGVVSGGPLCLVQRKEQARPLGVVNVRAYDCATITIKGHD
jgi:hypothetical protein